VSKKMQRRDPAPLPHPSGLCREPERASITGVKTSQWYALQRAGKAPIPMKVGLRTVAWRRADLYEWVEALKSVLMAVAILFIGWLGSLLTGAA